MDRSVWLQNIRRFTEEQEMLLAPSYDEHWGAIAPLHRQCFEHFLSVCPPQGHVLDAACGTGKYWPLILASGRTVFGIDQSQGALLRGREKFPEVPTQKVGLQEMSYRELFSGAACVDALEMVCPEDWPLVMRNLHRAITPQSYLYFTVELAEEQEIQAAFARGPASGPAGRVWRSRMAHGGRLPLGTRWLLSLLSQDGAGQGVGCAGRFQRDRRKADPEYPHYLVQK